MNIEAVADAKCEAPIKAFYGKRAVVEMCDKPAAYWWVPQRNPSGMQKMCQEHGELIAGNYKDELVLIAHERL